MITYHCPHCDSTNVLLDAYVDMNDPENVITFDDKVCNDCGEHFDEAVEKEDDQPEPPLLREFAHQLLRMVRRMNAGFPNAADIGVDMEQVEFAAAQLGMKKP